MRVIPRQAVAGVEGLVVQATSRGRADRRRGRLPQHVAAVAFLALLTLTGLAAPTSVIGYLADSSTAGVSVLVVGAPSMGDNAPPPNGGAGGHAASLPAPLVWADVSTPTGASPGKLERPSVAYDPDSSSDLLFGGGRNIPGEGVQPTGGTWTYANGAWSELNPSRSPPNATGASMAYDPAAGAYVLVTPTPVGQESNPPAPTWEFTNGGWSALDPVVVGGPPGTQDGAMAYDPSVGALLRFGGNQPGEFPWTDQISNATWAFELGSWYNVSTRESPPPLIAPSMAFDPTQDGVVLFGGLSSTVTGAVENQTWLWSNWTWTQLTLPWSPPRLTEAVLAWDSTVGGLVLAGGTSEFGTAGPGIQNNASFAFVNGSWTNLTPVGGFPGAVGGGAGYDPTSGGLLLFGGLGRQGELNSTWLLDRAPAVSIVTSRVLEDTGVPVVFSDPLAAAASGQTLRWAFGDGSSGSGSGPSHAFAEPGTYTVNLTGTLGNLGEVLTSWAMASVTIVASPLANVAIGNAFVDVNGYESASATAVYGVGPYSINWSFGDGAGVSGVWSVNHRYLIPGNFTLGATVTDSLGGTTTAEVPVHVQPYPRVALQVAQVAYDLGQSIWLGSATQYGSAPFTFSYDGLPPGCATENVSNYTCRPSSPGAYDVQVTVSDAHQIHVTSGLVVVNVAPPISGALNASARVIDLGSSVTVGAELASEGSGNVSVSFSSGLLCLVVGALGELCTPTSPGTYHVEGTATDLSGAIAPLTSTDFVVNPALELHATGPSGPVDRGTPVTLGVSVVGGTAPFHVSFESVPHGCYAENSTAFRCDLELAGTYTLSASVTDGVGSTAAVRAEVTVRVPSSGVGAAPTPAPPSAGSTDYLFWGLVLAAVAEIALSLRYARSPERRWRERMERIRKGLWSVFGSAPTDASDTDAVPGADAPP